MGIWFASVPNTVPATKIEANTRLNRGGCFFDSTPSMMALSNIWHIRLKPVCDLVSNIVCSEDNGCNTHRAGHRHFRPDSHR